MATPAQRDVCCCLIEQYFGSVVASVARTLFQFERAPLRLLCSQSKTSWKNVKKSLIILTKHQIINVYKQTGFSDLYEYEITPELVLSFSRSAKYIALAKQNHGEEGGLIIKNIIANGMIRISTLLHSTWEYLLRNRNIKSHREAKDLIEVIRSKILAFIDGHYIQRFDSDINKRLLEIPVVSNRRYNNELNPILYKASDINLTLFSDQLLSVNKFDIISELERMASNQDSGGANDDPLERTTKPVKRVKLDTPGGKGTPASDPDRGIYWRVNIDRFESDLRDRVLCAAVADHFDDIRTGLICEALLHLSRDHSAPRSAFTAPVAYNDLELHLTKRGIFRTKVELIKYMDILDNDKNFRIVVKSGFRPDKGVMFAVDVGQLIDRITRETLASIVACRFGPKCSRIFRLLLKNNYLVPKQIEESVMLPVKDVREYLYMLIKEGFVRSCQVPRTADFAPARSLFMMGVEFDFLVMCTIDRCCRSVANLIERHKSETQQNEVLLTHDQAVQNLIKSSRFKDSTDDDSNQNLNDDPEYQEYFTRHERSMLMRTKNRLNDLELSRHQVDDTLFLLHHWLMIKPNMGVEMEF